MRKFTVLISTCSTLVIGGCAAVPEPPRKDGIQVERIVDAVQCELASVYRRSPYASYLEDWLARVTLELKVTNDVAAGGPTVTGIPVVSSGTLNVPIGPDLSDTSFRTANIVFDVHMRDLKNVQNKNGDPHMPNCFVEYSGLPQAADSLGLGDWVGTIATAAGRPDHASLYEAAYDLEFTIIRGVHGGIVFKAVTVNIDAGSGLARKTSDNHLNVVFKSDPPAAKSKATGKTKASPNISQQLDLQRQRFLPQQLILQNQRGLTIQ